MIPNTIRLGWLAVGFAVTCLGCMGGGGHRATLTLGPEGANAPIEELPTKQSAQVCLYTAQEFDRNGRAPEAIALYEKARMLQPDLDKKLCRRLAVLYDQLGNEAKADEEFSKAMTHYPNDSDVLNDIGYSAYARGNWKQAEEHLTRSVELKPENKRAWINLGLAIAQQDRYPESMRAFMKACGEAEALCNLGFVLSVKGKKEQALETYRRAGELAPGLRLAQAAVDRYSNPDMPKSEGSTDKRKVAVKKTGKPGSTPYNSVSVEPEEPTVPPPPKRYKIVEELTQPFVIDPDLNSLPSRPARSRP